MTRKVGIIGAGIMGQGIALVSLLSGYQVYIYDIDQTSLEKAVSSIHSQYEKVKLKEELPQAVEHSKRLVIANSIKELGSCIILIEAITEKVSIKQTLFTELENEVPATTILASNTSGISITEIASSIKKRDRVIGTHFFNPASKMKLVEIIRGLETSEETVQKTTNFILSLGKTPIQVKDVPGFLVNKVITPMLNEAIHSVESGIASVEDIDHALKLAMAHPLGPLELADFIGLDTLLYFMEDLYKLTGADKYKPSILHRQMVAAGHLGKKSGRGFYHYTK